MTKMLMLLTSLLALAACSTGPMTPTNYVTPNAAATLTAAEAARQQAANAATAQSAEYTRQAASATQQAVVATQQAEAITTGTAQSIHQAHTATAETLSVRASEQALASQATFAAIAAKATATAVAQVALAEQRLIEDEVRRLALQREAELAAIEYQRSLNRLKPFFWLGLIVAAIVLATGISYRFYQQSRPITVTDISGPRVLVPANGWQVLPAGRPIPGQLALPAPSTLEPSEPPIPLPPLRNGHILIAGETGSGKSTAMLAVLQRRQNVIVLDPHNAPGTWGSAQVIGGGRDFTAIGAFMNHMRRLLSERYSQRNQGQTVFDPLTVATDEMPAIVSALGRQVDEVWREWLREGRKVGLFFIASTQSTRVKTLGIRGEGDLLENFAYVLLLGKSAADAYPDLVRGMERPAVICTLQRVRPVLIPLEAPTSLASTETPLFTAPVPTEESAGFADPNHLTEAVRERIRRLARELPSQAAVERTVFGYNGGAAYRAVKLVLDEAE